MKHILCIAMLLFAWAGPPAIVHGGARDCAEPPVREAGDAPAVGAWSEQLAKSEGKKRIELLIRRGEAYRAMGHYVNAGKDFTAALADARADARPRLEIVAMASLGYIRFLEGDAAQAKSLLLSALEMADDLDLPLLYASCANRLGNILFSRTRRKKALEMYEKALGHARRSNDAGLTTSVHINLARAREAPGASARDLQRARKTVDSVPSTRERARLLVEIAVEARRIQPAGESVSFAREALSEALSLAVKSGSDRTLSLSAGHLGRLYETQGRLEEALDFTERALKTAGRIQAHELLFQWEWLLARIFLTRGSRQEAMAAGRRAVFHIQAIRQDIPIRYHGGRSSFRETLAPIYYGLADMVLREAAGERDEEARQQLLREARDVVERIKRSEIRDYFNDPCIDARSRGVESLSPGVAVLYPIIFEDRLEVLVEVEGRLYRKTTGVRGKELKKTAAGLARILRDPYGPVADGHSPGGRQGRDRGEVVRLDGRTRGAAYEPLSRKIFEWLIRPVSPTLEEHGVSTLVYAPDGALRLLPLAALWDGEHFLVERYDTVVAPGLTLLDPRPTPRENPRALLAGVSRPGPSVLALPNNVRNRIRRSGSGAPDRGVRGPVVDASGSERTIEPGSAIHGDRKAEAYIKKALALPGVEKELQQISKTLESNVLLNEDFRLENFITEFRKHNYQIVHIASHGFFREAPRQSFIMTYDGLLKMDQLESLIKPRRLSAWPVDLIVLSACQTAEGDDRSPLGLTGVALKSGARGGLGSLWPVSDAAAQLFFQSFYVHLKNPENNKAEALRQARIDLMEQERFRHPFFWAPFILVGNWL